MLSFIICWIITLVFVKVYTSKQRTKIPDIGIIIIALIISGFFSLIQLFFGLIIKIVIGG